MPWFRFVEPYGTRLAAESNWIVFLMEREIFSPCADGRQWIPLVGIARATLCFLALLLPVGETQFCFAADGDEPLSIEFVPPTSPAQSGRPVGERWTIYFNGRIDEGAAERFREELTRREIESAAIFLNSRGGVLWQGLELGSLIRQHGFSTYVGRQNERGSTPLAGECYSACVYAFIGGSYRFSVPQSRIGVHRFSSLSPTDADADTAQIVSAAIVNYIRKMEVDVGLFDRMSRAGKDQILILAQADLEKLGVINNGRLSAEWAIGSLDGTTYLEGAQQTWLGQSKVRLSCDGGKVMFRPLFDAGDSAAATVESVMQHLIRFGDGYSPLADPLQPIAIQDGYVSAEFVLSRDQTMRLQNSISVGYAARLGNPNIFAGFTVDTAGANVEKIRGFLKSCER